MGLEKSWNGDISQATLNPQSVFPELYYPLWLDSFFTVSGTNTSGNSSYLMCKSLRNLTDSSNSGTILFTLNSNWNPNIDYAFEAAISSGTGLSVYAQLFDITSNTLVGPSITTTSNTYTPYRSSSFKLTPGHSYGVTIWTSNSSCYVYATDFSLIIFPPLLPASYNISDISLKYAKNSMLREMYIPLWILSNNVTTYENNDTSAGQYFLGKASFYVASLSYNTLFTLTSNWSSSQLFALESSFEAYPSGITGYIALWDTTTHSIVANSQLSTTSATPILLRSGTFTLTPGHSYGVTGWGSNSTGSAVVSKAHLVALAP